MLASFSGLCAIHDNARKVKAPPGLFVDRSTNNKIYADPSFLYEVLT
jgi:hypothetical protein